MRRATSIERDSYVEEVMELWEAGKRLVVTRALSGTGKTRAFYLLLKRIARMRESLAVLLPAHSLVERRPLKTIWIIALPALDRFAPVLTRGEA